MKKIKYIKYTVGNLHNGELVSFTSLKEAELCLNKLIEEENELNQALATEYEEQGLPIPDANDFYFMIAIV